MSPVPFLIWLMFPAFQLWRQAVFFDEPLGCLGTEQRHHMHRLGGVWGHGSNTKRSNDVRALSFGAGKPIGPAGGAQLL